MYLLGSDPETFLIDSDGNFVSAHDVIPGTKDNPFLVPCGAIQVDGVAAEFNTFPAGSEDEFLGNHKTVLDFLQSMVHQSRPDLTVVCCPTATFSEEYFKSLPKEARLLGCEPDFDAWTGKQNKPPKTNKPFRTGGGHIHIGWTKNADPYDSEHLLRARAIVRQLDLSLFRASFSWDDDETRRELYGSRGAFRPKSYGVEYRPLSNRWVEWEQTIREVYRQTMSALEDLDRGVIYEDEIQRVAA